MAAAAGHEASRTYGTYWARIVTTWADRRHIPPPHPIATTAVSLAAFGTRAD